MQLDRKREREMNKRPKTEMQQDDSTALNNPLDDENFIEQYAKEAIYRQLVLAQRQNDDLQLSIGRLDEDKQQLQEQLSHAYALYKTVENDLDLLLKRVPTLSSVTSLSNGSHEMDVDSSQQSADSVNVIIDQQWSQRQSEQIKQVIIRLTDIINDKIPLNESAEDLQQLKQLQASLKEYQQKCHYLNLENQRVKMMASQYARQQEKCQKQIDELQHGISKLRMDLEREKSATVQQYRSSVLQSSASAQSQSEESPAVNQSQPQSVESKTGALSENLSDDILQYVQVNEKLQTEVGRLKAILDVKHKESEEMNWYRDKLEREISRLSGQMASIPEDVVTSHGAYQQMQQELNYFKSEYESFESSIKEMKTQLQVQEEQYKTDIEQLKSDAESRQTTLQSDLKNLNSDLNRIRNIRDKLQNSLALEQTKLKSEVESRNALKVQMEALQKQLQSLKDGVDEKEFFDKQQSQLSDMTELMSKKDEQITKMILDKSKVDQKIAALIREKDANYNKSIALSKQAQKSDDLIKKLEADNLTKAEYISALEKEITELKELSAVHQKKAQESQLLVDALTARQEKFASTQHDIQLQVDEKDKLISQLRNQISSKDEKVAELQNDINQHQRRMKSSFLSQLYDSGSGDGKSSSGGKQSTQGESVAVDKDELEMLKGYKKIATCSICNFRLKNMTLAKCMHCFCNECITQRHDSRQRKCPQCGVAFGLNDMKQIYI
ncbi:hypothetical protein MP228_012064 [Amoeboaphelidium protococcarum]|nr:hypothetical protein MP228_012064 [Amoeboaphelidium protococcarum]